MQQIAMQNSQGGNNPGQMNPQQMQNMQIAQQQHQQQQAQAQQVAQAAQAAAVVAQQSQAQSQAQQPPQPQAPPQAQQAGPPMQQPNMQQQQAAAAAIMQQQQRQGAKQKHECIMKLSNFGDALSSFGVSSKTLQSYIANGAQRSVAQGAKQKDDLEYWARFVHQFFSPTGVLRHTVWVEDDAPSNKQYEITFPALPRYYHTHFESGIRSMQMIMEKAREMEWPNNGHYVESPKTSFVQWFDTGAQVSISCNLIRDRANELVNLKWYTEGSF